MARWHAREQDPAVRGHRGGHTRAHACSDAHTGVRTLAPCTHARSHTHTHPLPRPRLQAATARRRGTAAKDSRDGHCPGRGHWRAEWARTGVRPEGLWEPQQVRAVSGACPGRVRGVSDLTRDTRCPVPSAGIAAAAGLARDTAVPAAVTADPAPAPLLPGQEKGPGAPNQGAGRGGRGPAGGHAGTSPGASDRKLWASVPVRGGG